MIPFSGSYTREQWAHGLRLAYHPSGRGLILRVLVALLVIGGFGFILYGFAAGKAGGTSLLRTAILLLLMGWWLVQPYFRVWQAARRPWREGSGGVALEGLVTGDGLRLGGSEGAPVEKWDDYVKARVQEEMVVLIGADRSATILPRAFFANDSDWQGFRQLVELQVVTPR